MNAEAAHEEYGIDIVAMPAEGSYDAILVAVAHHQFKDAGAAVLRKFGKDKHVLVDLKYVFTKEESDFRL